jgi:23S rRNA (uracil1939-C5)-methyltransferase
MVPELSTTVEVTAQTLGVGGVAICVPNEDPSGKKIFVHGIIPQEQGLVKIQADKKNYCEGQLIQITKLHKHRIQPPCEYIKFCGGCCFQHMTIGQERAEKILMIQSYLERQGGLSVPEIIDASSGLPEFGYRRRITLHLSHDGLLGFHKPGTGQVIPIAKCLLAEDPINKAIPVIQSVSEQLCGFAKSIEINNENQISLTIFLRNQITAEKLLSQSQWFGKLLSLGAVFLRTKTSTDEVIKEKNRLRLIASDKSIGHFSQVNRKGNQVLHNLVMDNLDIKPPASITELYAGSGNFTIPLANSGYTVEAVEFDGQLVRAGQKLIAQQKLESTAKIIQSSCEKYVRQTKTLGNLVILDPPRAGAKDVVKLANWDHTEAIVYISCDLSSFSRDASMLTKNFGFSLSKVFFIDMFPKTAHVEILGILKKNL